MDNTTDVTGTPPAPLVDPRQLRVELHDLIRTNIGACVVNSFLGAYSSLYHVQWLSVSADELDDKLCLRWDFAVKDLDQGVVETYTVELNVKQGGPTCLVQSSEQAPVLPAPYSENQARIVPTKQRRLMHLGRSSSKRILHNKASDGK